MSKLAEQQHQTSRSNRGFDDSKQLVLIQANNLQKILIKQSNELGDQGLTCYPWCLNTIGKICIPCALCCKCCFSFPLYQQQTGQLGLLERFGKYIDDVEPGLKVLNPITERVKSVSLKTNTLAFEQQVITKDNVQLKIQTVLFVRVIVPSLLSYKLGTDYSQAVQCVTEVARASLRFIVGSILLQKLIESREKTAQNLAYEINRQISIWGIMVDRCSIKQLLLPFEISQSLSQVAKTRRRMQAMMISAKANVQSSKFLAQVSHILDNKAAMQIRYLQAIQQILGNNKNNVIFLKLNPDK